MHTFPLKFLCCKKFISISLIEENINIKVYRKKNTVKFNIYLYDKSKHNKK